MQNKLLNIVILFLILLGCKESKENRMKIFLLKGNQALVSQNFEQAEKYFYESLKLDSCFEDAFNNLGTVAFRQQHFNEAIEFYTHAIECNQNYFSAFFNRANAYQEIENYSGALEDIGKLMEIKPDTAVIYFIQGLIGMKIRDNNLSYNSFSKAIDLDSQNVAYFVNRATVNLYRGYLDDAADDLVAAKRLDPNEGNIYNTLAMIEIERNNLLSAKIAINKAIELVPNQPYFLNNRGYIFLMQNKLDIALKDINHSLELEPQNGWAIRNLGVYYLFSFNYPKALELFQQAEKMDFNIDNIHYYLGTAYLKNGYKQKAQIEFVLSQEAGETMMRTE